MIKNRILITGGGGFIGTQVAWELAELGHDITIVDREPPKHNFPGLYKVSDYLDFFIQNETRFDTVVHLAAEHLVEQSVTEPEKYYTNNVVKMKAMLDIMVAKGMKNIIFSSSGNTYGRQGENGPLKEDVLFYDPQNPYASSKVAGELMIKDYARAYGLKYVTFRYFNAAGADPARRFGYVQRPATHVIPIICNKILNSEVFKIYGNDYPTKDGTCVRDYVHVKDLATAHARAVDFLNNGKGNEIFNVGGGNNGVSVKELVRYASEVVGREPIFEYAGRREGDPAMLVADISKAQYMLGWKPEYTIRHTILHAWNWECDFEARNNV
jgi:UDP-glucose 4-epimerase